MTFNPLKEKGISLDKQLRSWYDIVKDRLTNIKLIVIQEQDKF